ncbi:MAG: hypothetical protein IJ214_10345 [Clostridia bacterium]|nr:hypothetical protein [Clostridia bacterium]
MKKRSLYLLFQSVLCVMICAWLIYAAIAPYANAKQDGQVYTPENAAAAFGQILPILLLLAATSAAGWVFHWRQADSPVRSSTGAVYRAGLSHAFAIRAVLLVLSAALILWGILNGSMRDVLYKAITICSECIGLG